MSAKRVALDPDYLVREYGAGCTGAEIGRKLGVSQDIVRARLRDLGVTIDHNRKPAKVLAKRVPLPDAEISTRYLAGESENAIAKSYGVNRWTIRHRLLEAGTPIRDQSAAEALKWSRMDSDRRAAQVSAAHDAARGRAVTLEEKLSHARTNEARRNHVSAAEVQLAEMLAKRGLVTIPQQAIGPYNCDLGAEPVAVEVYAGHWHWYGDHLARVEERFRYILNAGWHILVVHSNPLNPLTSATADYVVAYVEQTRRDPSTRREYRVVRGAGETIAAGSVDDDKITIVPAFTAGRNPLTGRYTRVAR